MRKLVRILGFLVVGVLALGAADSVLGAQAKYVAAPTMSDAARAEEVVVIGRRSGVPIWRVKSGRTTLVLVGTISGVTKDTKWDPTALVKALRKADRVMFPEMQRVRASPFAMLGYLARWRRQATLPAGQSLKQYLTPEQFQRLVQLRSRGIAKAGSERRHPLHLAMSLRAIAKGNIGYGEDAGQYVMRAVQRFKLRLVPIQARSAKPLADELFDGSPVRHVRCLDDAMTLAEAGPAAVSARSHAWAQRRVPEVLSSPAEGVYHTCFPVDPAAVPLRQAALHATIRRLLDEPQLTVAVLELQSLAGMGGVLDELAGAGYQVQGPAWRRQALSS